MSLVSSCDDLVGMHHYGISPQWCKRHWWKLSLIKLLDVGLMPKTFREMDSGRSIPQLVGTRILLEIFSMRDSLTWNHPSGLRLMIEWSFCCFRSWSLACNRMARMGSRLHYPVLQPVSSSRMAVVWRCTTSLVILFAVAACQSLDGSLL